MSTAVGNAQEISVTGATLGPRLRLPAGYMIDQGTRAGLLLVQELAGSSPVRYELWDPGTRQVTRSFVNLIAAGPAEIAWMPGCTAGCRVHVLGLPGGRVEQISLPGRSKPYDGAFSPDGRLLALLVTARVTRAGRAAATRLMVATVAGGRITAVPGTTVGSGNGVAFGWQARKPPADCRRGREYAGASLNGRSQCGSPVMPGSPPRSPGRRTNRGRLSIRVPTDAGIAQL